MPLNSLGIWEYDEFEDAAPFSTMLNRLTSSLTDLLTGIVEDTGWLDCTPSAGTEIAGSFIVQARQIGPVVYIDGRATRASSAASQLWFTLPSGVARPRRTETLQAPSNVQEAAFTYVDGNGAIRTSVAMATSYSMHLNARYVI